MVDRSDYGKRFILLLSSIPPCLRGEAFDSSKPDQLQNRVLKSWKELTSLIASIHTAHELESNPSLSGSLASEGVIPVTVSNPEACSLRHLPHLCTSLQWAADSHPNSIVVLTNSDIVLSPTSDLRSSLCSLEPDEMMLARRLNIQHFGDSNLFEQFDNAGFDLFAFHASAIPLLLPFLPDVLQFGVPWWDLYLPLACIAAGLKLVKPSDSSTCLHLNHSDRWNADTWFRVGVRADAALHAALRMHSCTELAESLNRCKRQAYLRKFSSLKYFVRYLRGQQKSLIARRGFSPLYLFAYGELLNSLLDQSTNSNRAAA
jgi:hypothetical protein